MSIGKIAASLIALFGLSGIAQAETLYACKLNGVGTVRMVSATTTCITVETKISWNSTGAQGPAGPTGATGPAGPQGATGREGPGGPMGSMGLQGGVGPVGPRGPQGDMGPAGPKGADGATGLAGAKGDTGATGATGSPGLKGDKGDTGPAGSSGTGTSCPPGSTTTTTGYYVDCGDGTLVDTSNGLMWEQKTEACAYVDFTDPHCYLNRYTWTDNANFVFPYLPTGTLYSDFLERLNDLKTPSDGAATPCFANHCDWRIPEIGELRSILLTPFPCSTCIDPAFGPTPSSLYWSSSTVTSNPARAWTVNFYDGGVDYNRTKYGELYYNASPGGLFARAVRGGR